MKPLFYILTLFSCVMLYSCRTHEDNIQEATILAQQRFSQLDLTQPDQYPLFADCHPKVEDASNCFYSQLSKLIAAKLANHQLQFELTKRDSIMAQIVVNQSGEILYRGLQHTNMPTQQLQVLDSVLTQRLIFNKTIEPAYKAGIPVNTLYLLPVIILPVNAE